MMRNHERARLRRLPLCMRTAGMSVLLWLLPVQVHGQNDQPESPADLFATCVTQKSLAGVYEGPRYRWRSNNPAPFATYRDARDALVALPAEACEPLLAAEGAPDAPWQRRLVASIVSLRRAEPDLCARFDREFARAASVLASTRSGHPRCLEIPRLLRTLDERSDPLVLEALLHLDSAPHVRRAVLGSLGLRPSLMKQAIDPLISLLSLDTPSGLRAEVAMTLGRLGRALRDRRPIRPLVELEKSLAAAESFGRGVSYVPIKLIGGPDALAALEELRNFERAHLAARGLDPEHDAPLRELLLARSRVRRAVPAGPVPTSDSLVLLQELNRRVTAKTRWATLQAEIDELEQK